MKVQTIEIVKYCVAAGCSNTNINGISLYQFLQDPVLGVQWTKEVQRTQADWQGLSNYSILSSNLHKRLLWRRHNYRCKIWDWKTKTSDQRPFQQYFIGNLSLRPCKSEKSTWKKVHLPAVKDPFLSKIYSSRTKKDGIWRGKKWGLVISVSNQFIGRKINPFFLAVKISYRMHSCLNTTCRVHRLMRWCNIPAK